MGQLSELLSLPLPWAGNLATLLVALVVGLCSYGLMISLRWLLRRRLQTAPATASLVDDLALEATVQVHRPVLMVLALSIGLRLLPLPEPLPWAVHQAQWLSVAVQMAIWSDVIARFVALAISRTLSDGKHHFPGLQLGVKLVLWVFVGFVTLDNLGVNLNSLLTGLGIGGIAVALAAQRLISDLISTVTIAMDRPFVEGDLISVGDVTGQVLRIGLKTTRLKSSTGEELIIPNADLVSLKVRNLSRLETRIHSLSVPVSWNTPSEKLEALPGQLAVLLEEFPEAKLEYAMLVGTTAAGYRYDLVYTLLARDESKNLPIQQKLLLKIARLLEQEGITVGVEFPVKTTSPVR